MTDLTDCRPEALHFGSAGPVIRWTGPDGRKCTTDFRRFYPTNVGVGHTSGTLRVQWEDTSCLAINDLFYPDVFKQALLRSGCGRDLQTTWKDFVEVAASCKPVALRGMVFHPARCGSTLVHRMLNKVDSAFSLCEPGTFGALLDVVQGWSDPAAKEALASLLRVLGRPVAEGTNKFFIKFSDSVAISISDVRRLLPEVPSLFIYRNPHEILVSVLRGETGTIIQWRENREKLAESLNLPELADPGMLTDEAAACLLGNIFKAVIVSLDTPAPLAALKIVDYSSLPECFATVIAPHFGLDLTGDELTGVAAAAGKYSKSADGMDFRPDKDEKKRAVTPRIAELVERFVAPHSDRCRQLCAA